MTQPTFALGIHRLSTSIRRFHDDEDGSMAFFFLLMFVLMITFGGIAIDVMRFETRRVAMQQTLDRAALAAASLTQSRTPKQVVDDYFAKADLASGLDMVEFGTPQVTSVTDAGLRRVSVSADVTSQNFFMTIFSKNDFLAGPAVTEAAQGVSQIEVMLVLDITGSMNDPAVAGETKSKIQALREAAQDFVTIVKNNDKKDGVSIGVVPYAAQVNIPAELRAEYTVQNLSSWNNVANQGVPDINCFEFPTSGFNSTAVSLSSPIRMAAVADSNSSTTTDGTRVAPQTPTATSRACTTLAEDSKTTWKEVDMNKVLLPTKVAATVNTKISRLTAGGNTYIAVGMRWGTALLDQAARPIYTKLLKTEPGMAGRPADNSSIQTRKIIILMTDGEHVTNTHVLDAYKSGLSPIWRGADGNFAIRFINPSAPAAPIRPGSGTSASTSCSGWQLTNYANREYFVPHLKRNTVAQKTGSDPEGVGKGTATANACDPQAWLATPTWTGSGTAVRLDWSEVWRYVRVSWVAQQLYVRSGVTGMTNYTTNMNNFRTNYLTSVANLNSLLQTNCTAAKTAGMEIYGIAFAAPANGQTQISNCSSEPKENYYFNATDGDKLLAAFKAIATDISELRLTQ